MWKNVACALTPKAFHNTAQGRPRSGRTLGGHTPIRRDTPKGLQNGDVPRRAPVESSATLSGLTGFGSPRTQGALPSVATLGWIVKPFQGRLFSALRAQRLRTRFVSASDSSHSFWWRYSWAAPGLRLHQPVLQRRRDFPDMSVRMLLLFLRRMRKRSQSPKRISKRPMEKLWTPTTRSQRQTLDSTSIWNTSRGTTRIVNHSSLPVDTVRC